MKDLFNDQGRVLVDSLVEERVSRSGLITEGMLQSIEDMEMVVEAFVRVDAKRTTVKGAVSASTKRVVATIIALLGIYVGVAQSGNSIIRAVSTFFHP